MTLASFLLARVETPAEAAAAHPVRHGLAALELQRGLLVVVLQKAPSEANPKVRNHGEGPY